MKHTMAGDTHTMVARTSRDRDDELVNEVAR